MGWLPDLPDSRDYTVGQAVKSMGVTRSEGRVVDPTAGDSTKLPTWVDLRLSGWLSPVEDQEELGSCTAQAVVGMLEAFHRRASGELLDLSRLFLYKVSRRLLGFVGDSGAFIRDTIKATATVGVPPEALWPYVIDRFEDEPDAFLYAYASNFKATRYARLDTESSLASLTAASKLDEIRACAKAIVAADSNSVSDSLEEMRRALRSQSRLSALMRLKQVLAAGYTAAFGFPVYRSIAEPRLYRGEVPWPRQGDVLDGGHAVLAVGFDDSLESTGPENTRGAVIFKNSWSEQWGDAGYGYLPYSYFREGLAVDIWTIFNSEWIREGVFEDYAIA